MCHKCRDYGYLVEEKGGYLRVVHNIKKDSKWITRFCYVGSPEKTIRFLEKNEDVFSGNRDYEKVMDLLKIPEHGLNDAQLMKAVLDIRKIEKKLRKRLASA